MVAPNILDYTDQVRNLWAPRARPVLAAVEEKMPPFDQTLDKPQSFGFKTLWFAVGTTDPASVLDALEFGPATPSNWASGVEAAYLASVSRVADPWMFVSPPIDGWVLAMSASFPYPVDIEAYREIGRKFDVLFSRLTKRFGDVQFFGSHRVVGFVTWARALGGKPRRIFGLADGDVLVNVGEQTAEEARLGFPDLSGLSPLDACERIFALAEEQGADEDRLVASGLSHREARERVRENGRDALPDESDVADLAALWSIDPTRLSDQDHPAGIGLVARLPIDLAP
jgi:hypothetical protein